jgi:hypothetical protein
MGEYIWINQMFDKKLIFKVCKELSSLVRKPPNLKIGKEPECTFAKRKHMKGQWVYKKILSISNYHGNANQNHNEISYLLEWLLSKI